MCPLDYPTPRSVVWDILDLLFLFTSAPNKGSVAIEFHQIIDVGIIKPFIHLKIRQFIPRLWFGNLNIGQGHFDHFHIMAVGTFPPEADCGGRQYLKMLYL